MSYYTLLSTSLYIALIEIHVIGLIFFFIFLEYTGIESVILFISLIIPYVKYFFMIYV